MALATISYKTRYLKSGCRGQPKSDIPISRLHGSCNATIRQLKGLFLTKASYPETLAPLSDNQE